MKKTILALTLLLAACAGTDQLSKYQPPGYLRDAPEMVANADWSAPEVVRIELANYQFTPDEIVLHRDRPTRLELVNTTDKNHSFVSKDLFPTLAVKSLGDQPGPWVERILVPPHETKTLLFVPARFGAFKFECDITGHAAFGMTGVVNVQ